MLLEEEVPEKQVGLTFLDFADPRTHFLIRLRGENSEESRRYVKVGLTWFLSCCSICLSPIPSCFCDVSKYELSSDLDLFASILHRELNNICSNPRFMDTLGDLSGSDSGDAEDASKEDAVPVLKRKKKTVASEPAPEDLERLGYKSGPSILHVPEPKDSSEPTWEW